MFKRIFLFSQLSLKGLKTIKVNKQDKMKNKNKRKSIYVE